MNVQFWLKINIENDMTKLGPLCIGCCFRSITYHAVTTVTSGAHTHTHTLTHTHAHTHTHTPQSVQENDE